MRQISECFENVAKFHKYFLDYKHVEKYKFKIKRRKNRFRSIPHRIFQMKISGNACEKNDAFSKALDFAPFACDVPQN